MENENHENCHDDQYYIEKIIEKTIENHHLAQEVDKLSEKLEENKRRLSHMEVEVEHCKWLNDRLMKKIK